MYKRQQLTRLAESIYLLPEAEDVQAGYSYTATASPIYFKDLKGKALNPAPATNDELQLPNTLSGKLKTASLEFSKEPDLYKKLESIRQYLRENYKYSLETTNADDSNPLENFLYSEKRGYCEHFATAAAMFCRTIGVPSRIAYGWSGGRLYKDQNMFMFRAKDAHAWTEIKIQGYGWVVFDTTPPDDSATPETQTAPEGEKAPNPSEALNMDNDTDSENEDTAIGLEIDSAKLIIALGILCLSVLLFLTVRYVKRTKTTPDGRTITRNQPSYLIYFKQTCAALGHPMPLGRTLRQHVTELNTHPIAPDFSNELLGYHYQMIYGEGEKEAAKEKQLLQAIRKWRNTHTTEATRNG